MAGSGTASRRTRHQATSAGGYVSAWLAVGLCVVGWPGAAYAQTGAPSSGDWPYYGGDAGHTRYSPLDQITLENASDLTEAWTWSSANFGPRADYKNEATPIAVDGTLYVTAGARRAVVAIDGASGETLWMWRMDEGVRGARAPRRGAGRGVAYWTDGTSRRVFTLTPGYRLVALDAESGRPVEDFGENGIVDVADFSRSDLDPVGRIGASSPPLVIGDIVVVGAALQVGLRPPEIANIPGDVYGIDARTGERVWTFHTIPLENEPGRETWEGDSAVYTGNAAVWAPMSADLEAGLVYLPVEAPTSDYYGGHRLGDNLYANSLVALNGQTGEVAWHFQILHHDIWDFDNPTAPILADVVVDGAPRRVVVQLTKQSYAYVFDRVTGEPIWPIVETAVPPSDVPGERASPTQPIPSKPAPYDQQGVTVDDLIDFTPELRAEAIEALSGVRLGELFQPPSLVGAPDGTGGTLHAPGNLGGANWEGGAADARTGLVYVGSMTAPSVMGLGSDPERSELDYIMMTGGLPRVQGLPIMKPPYGRITAIDLKSGDHSWMMANADTPSQIANHEALAGIEIPRTGRATRAGLLVTATGLFAGEGYRGAPVLRAHDKATGEIAAEIELPASQSGLPMSYLAGGRQYIVVPISEPGYPSGFVALTLPRTR